MTEKYHLTDRKRFAAKAFNVSSHYDTAIFNYFNDPQEITALKISELKGKYPKVWRKPTPKRIFLRKL